MNDPRARQLLTRADGLATALRKARGSRSGLSIAKQFDWASSKITRIEQGLQVPSDNDIDRWAEACELGPEATAELHRKLEEFKQLRPTQRQRSKATQPTAILDTNVLLSAATLVRSYSLDALPAIVQLPEYAAALLGEEFRPAVSSADLSAAVDERMRRQSLLYDRTRRFEIVIDEAVLHRRRGSVEVMRAQLDRLLSLTGTVANVRFGIVPFREPVKVSPRQGFTIYDDRVVVEAFAGDQLVDDADLGLYSAALEELWAVAVEGDQARRSLLEVIGALDAG